MGRVFRDRLWRFSLIAIAPLAIAAHSQWASRNPAVHAPSQADPSLPVLLSLAPPTTSAVPRRPRVASSTSQPHVDTLAPVDAPARDRSSDSPVLTSAPFLQTLTTMLTSAAEQRLDPVRRSVALTYLGLLGVHDHREQLLADADRKTRPVDALPVLDTLVNGYGDHSRLPLLRRIADDKHTDTFRTLWAHELLVHAGDRSRMRALRALARSPRTPLPHRLKALGLLADLDDDSMQTAARSIGEDQRLFQTTRLDGLACLARMEWTASSRLPRRRRSYRPSTALRALRDALDSRRLSLSERLSLADHLAVVGDESIVPFLYGVVEKDRRTVIDQIRALNTLALTGRHVHLRTLRTAARLRPRTRNAAARVLALMGDHSMTASLVEACRSGNLDAARTLVLTRVLDQLKIPATQIRSRLRYRILLDS